jgi:uncharacterized repeat protein (TIGR03803 family)
MHVHHVVTAGNRQSRVLIAVIVISTLLLAAKPSQAGEKVIFNPSSYMGDPQCDLIVGGDGVLYGTSRASGGSVFSLTPPTKGQSTWTGTILYQFQGGSDGYGPPAGVIPDQQGGFFGVTSEGGGGSCNAFGLTGCGTVFRITPPTLGQTNWSETVLYRFQGGSDGAFPGARLLLDSATGVLYGTTYIGGPSNAGTVFALSPPAQGQTAWTETVLDAFTGALDGGYPYAYLIPDGKGNLYGTTTAGGFSGNGTVFELGPPAEGQTNWTETVLYAFQGWGFGDAGTPDAGLVFDTSGNLYSTTAAGGTPPLYLNAGTVFELSPPSVGTTNWTETILYSFTGQKDGAIANNDILIDRNGVIYSTTEAGGKSNLGTVFKLTPPGVGETAWTEKVLYNFKPSPDGNFPASGLAVGNVRKEVVLFGVTLDGGNVDDVGVAYEITGSGFAP